MLNDEGFNKLELLNGARVSKENKRCCTRKLRIDWCSCDCYHVDSYTRMTVISLTITLRLVLTDDYYSNEPVIYQGSTPILKLFPVRVAYLCREYHVVERVVKADE